MIKVIRKHQKKFLAGLSIFAMISFVIGFGNRGRGEGGVADHAVATVNGGSISLSEVTQAHAELDDLKKYVKFSSNNYMDYQVMAAIVGGKPDLFMLLRHEANTLGLAADEDDVQTTMKYRVSPELTPDSDNYGTTVDGVRDMFKIMSRYKQLRDAIKVSRPQVDQLLAKQESLNLALVQLKAEDYLAKVPPPTTQQLQDQFNKFADTAPKNPLPTTNPFGFGYKLPVRVSFQYVRVTTDDVTAAVVATKSIYDWNVQAKKYYYAHPDEFQQPAEAPMGPTLPTTLPVAKLPATLPTRPKPFDAVEKQILADLRQQQIADLTTEVTNFITTTLNTDWQTYSKFIAANPTTSPSTPEPVSSLGVPFSSFTYLIKLNDKVQEKFKVDILPSKSPDFLNADQYSGLPLLGSPATSDFITKQASAYIALHDKKDPAAGATLMQPSPALDGPGTGSQLFIRLSAVLPAQPPADVALVRPQVELDWRTEQAYNIAQAQAKALLIAAKTGNLDAAALASGHPVIPGDTTLSYEKPDIKAIIPPLGNSTLDFFKQSYNLLNVYDPAKDAHPAETIELPAQQRIFVAQLKSVIAKWDDQSYFRSVAEAQAQAGGPAMTLTRSWLDVEDPDLKALKERMGYKPLKGNE
jgi:hypothetical protein